MARILELYTDTHIYTLYSNTYTFNTGTVLSAANFMYKEYEMVVYTLHNIVIFAE